MLSSNKTKRTSLFILMFILGTFTLEKKNNQRIQF